MSTPFNPAWLQPGAAVMVDIQTTAALLDEIKQCKKAFELYAEANAGLLKANDRMRELLERCETEMRYAGWASHPQDANQQRKDLYLEVGQFLDPPERPQTNAEKLGMDLWSGIV